MKRYDISRSIYTVSDFLSWQRSGHLELSPSFQRRSVWKPGAKSFLVHTIARGLPVPVIFIRDRLELESAEVVREVVDGQQRLRTILAYVEPTVLSDFDPARDSFTVSKTHNKELAGKPFERLDKDLRTAILTYQFSVHVLPIGTAVYASVVVFEARADYKRGKKDGFV